MRSRSAQSLGQGDVANDGAEFGHGQVDHGHLEVLNVQDGLARVAFIGEHLIVDDEIQVNHHVVGGDVLLGGNSLGPLPDTHLGSAEDDGYQEAEARPDYLVEPAESLHHHPFLLLDNDYSRCHFTPL